MTVARDRIVNYNLEGSVARVLRAFADLLGPAEACIAIVVVSQIAWCVGLPGTLWWLPPAAAAATCVWAISAWLVGQRLQPPLFDWDAVWCLAERLSAIRLPKLSGGVVLGAVIAYALMAAPWWPAVVCWAVLCLGALLFPMGLKRAVVASGVFSATIAAASTLMALLLTEPELWIGRLLGVCLGLCLVALIVRAIGLASRRHLPVGSLARLVVPLVVVGLLSVLTSPSVVVGLVVFGLLLWPAFLLLMTAYLYASARDNNRKYLLENPPFGRLGADARGPREDEVRDSDGYYDICYPEYRHWSAELTGEGGYFTSPGDTDDRFLGRNCVMFRTSDLAFNPLTETDGAQGSLLAELCLRTAPSWGSPELEELRGVFDRTWTVRLVGQREPMTKMPWDHPWLLVVPVTWDDDFTYPVGSGIHDRDGYPCFVPRASVRISLKRTVIDAVNRLNIEGAPDAAGPPSPPDVAQCRMLLHNAARILPGAYESLLTILVRQFRNESIKLYLEHERSALEQPRQSLITEINRTWPLALPKPLGELVDCSVVDLGMSTHYDALIFPKIDKLRQRREQQQGDMAAQLKQLDEKVRSEVRSDFAQSTNGTPPTDGEMDLRSTIAYGLSDIETKIRKQVEQSVTIISSLANGDDGRYSNAFAQVQNELTTQTREFDRALKTSFGRMRRSLNSLTDTRKVPK